MNDFSATKQQNQESQQIEWKWSWQDEFLKWLCGYANTEGGTLYIGVSDDGYHIPKSVSEKLINQYICGKLNAEKVESTDKRYKSLVIIEKENKIWEKTDGTREYMSIEIIKYPFAISCDGKYYVGYGSCSRG